MSDFAHEERRIKQALQELRQLKHATHLDKPRIEENSYREIGRAIVNILDEGHFVHLTQFWAGLQSPKRLEHSYGHHDFKCPECGCKNGIK